MTTQSSASTDQTVAVSFIHGTGVFENGNLVDCVYDYEAAKVIVHNRKDQWMDHGK